MKKLLLVLMLITGLFADKGYEVARGKVLQNKNIYVIGSKDDGVLIMLETYNTYFEPPQTVNPVAYIKSSKKYFEDKFCKSPDTRTYIDKFKKTYYIRTFKNNVVIRFRIDCSKVKK